MTAFALFARAAAPANRDTLYVGAIAGLVLAAACAALVHYGSFARMLIAFGLVSTG